ncbi:hypothetical protein [Haloferula sp.]|uniref:hypothetical protein n=1 Tax=Haloferula sp. TaxID=2497595 RepID=UPI00329CA516
MIRHRTKLVCPSIVKKARREPARLSAENQNFWEDMREILLDPSPDTWALEVVRRWLRDEVESGMIERLRRGNAAGIVRSACQLAPRQIWRLPFSRGLPPERYQRRIVAILLPRRLKQVEQQLAVFAFQEGL